MTTLQNGLQLIKQHKGTTAAVIGGSALAVGLGTALVVSSSKKRRKKSKRTYSKRYKQTRRRKQKQPHTAGKRKDTSHRRIRYTKNNQPYIIQANGRAKFISKKSARSSRKRKGGRY